jgi:hypothetical protein
MSLYAQSQTLPIFQGTVTRIGDGLRRAHPNSGDESKLLYYAKSNAILAVWRSVENNCIVSARCINGKWEPAVDTPYGKTDVEGRHIGGLDADVDSKGYLHYVWERFYGCETEAGHFIDPIRIPHPNRNGSYEGRPVVFIHPSISLDKSDNILYYARGAWCDTEFPYLMAKKSDTPYNDWFVLQEGLGADDLRPHLAWQTASYDRSRFHFCWSTVAHQNSNQGKWAMALAHRSLRFPEIWDGPGQAVSPYIPNGPRKKDFSPRLTLDRQGQVHVIFMHDYSISYICKLKEGWGPIEVIDSYVEPEPTMKIRTLWNITVDLVGRVYAFYHTPADVWRLRVRTPGKAGIWYDGPILPAGTYGYTGAATPDGTIHFLYGNQDGVWHNRLFVH